MANKQKKVSRDKNEPSTEEKIAEFLRSGGKIQQIPSGLSGQVKKSGPRQITLGSGK